MQLVESLASLTTPEQLFEDGLAHLKKHRSKKALDAFRRALEAKPSEPRFMSYFGLCLASTEGKIGDALPLVEKAARKEFFRPELYFNLSLRRDSNDIVISHIIPLFTVAIVSVVCACAPNAAIATTSAMM